MKHDIIELIYQNQGIIWNICNTFYSNTEDREDLFQEISIQLWKSYPKFENRSKFSTWLYRVALNSAISFKRKKRNFLEYKDGYHEIVDHDHDTDEESKIDLLYKSIEKLSKIDKAVVLLYLEEKSYSEIAEITGFSVKNISVKLVRIRRKLDQIYNSLK